MFFTGFGKNMRVTHTLVLLGILGTEGLHAVLGVLTGLYQNAEHIYVQQFFFFLIF